MLEIEQYNENIKKINIEFENKEKSAEYFKKRIQLLQELIIELRVCN